MADDDEHLAYGNMNTPSNNIDDGSNRGFTQKAGGGFSSFFGKITDAVKDIKNNLTEGVSTEMHGIGKSKHRYDSFAEPRDGNDVKWYVDGCGYFWAVSVALEQARESVWILDWWLSPELYLRRPPAENEQYRLDRMLLAAAQRGVKINIIVYK